MSGGPKGSEWPNESPYRCGNINNLLRYFMDCRCLRQDLPCKNCPGSGKIPGTGRTAVLWNSHQDLPANPSQKTPAGAGKFSITFLFPGKCLSFSRIVSRAIGIAVSLCGLECHTGLVPARNRNDLTRNQRSGVEHGRVRGSLHMHRVPVGVRPRGRGSLGRYRAGRAVRRPPRGLDLPGLRSRER